MPRYNERDVFENREEAHEELREARGIKKINHYETAVFTELDKDDYAELSEVTHIWTTGDRFYKLSHKYYGSTQYWWVIARYNKCPTEIHVRLGRRIIIPLPLNKILGLYGV